MEAVTRDGRQRFRVWIVRCADWRPQSWHDVPPQATAIEPADQGLYSEAEAALFVHGFNGSLIGSDQPLWAVAVPIAVRYEGDARAGQPVCGHSFAAEWIAAAVG